MNNRLRWGLFLLLLSTPGIVWSAHAIVYEISDIGAYRDAPAPTFVRWNVKVAYQGADVPGTEMSTSLSVTVTTNTTISQLTTALVVSVTTYAFTQGFTVPVGGTFIPTYSAQ